MFSDAVFALAVVFLFLQDRIPQDAIAVIVGIHGLLPFALSFAALVTLWAIHRGLFRRYRLDDNYAIVVNALLLFTVLLFTYPLKFISAAVVGLFAPRLGMPIESLDDLGDIYTVFSGGWIIVFACFALLYQRAYAERENLQLSTLDAYDARTHALRYFGFVVIGLICAALSILRVGINAGLPIVTYIPLIVILVWLITQRRSRERKILAAKVAEHPQLAYTGAIRTDEIQQLIK
jgi:uncharacterized membrane protein